MQAFEQIMETDADHRAGLNLVVCCFAIGDKERMKQAFVRLANVRPVAALHLCAVLPVQGGLAAWHPGPSAPWARPSASAGFCLPGRYEGRPLNVQRLYRLV